MSKRMILTISCHRIWRIDMSYSNQIRILEAKLKQLEQSEDKKDLEKMAQIINDLRRLRKLEWEETYERVNLDDDR